MTFYDVTKLFWAFWAVGNLSFQNFFVPLAFGNKDVLCLF